MMCIALPFRYVMLLITSYIFCAYYSWYSYLAHYRALIEFNDYENPVYYLYIPPVNDPVRINIRQKHLPYSPNLTASPQMNTEMRLSRTHT
jgi:hypothetical protein